MSNLADTMPLATLLGIDVTDADAERVVGTMAIRPDMCTIGNSVHGGALMAFADSLAAIGAFLNLPDGASGTTTIESTTKFLGAAAEGTALTAESTPVKVGRRVSVWQTMVSAPDDRPVALVTQTQMVL